MGRHLPYSSERIAPAAGMIHKRDRVVPSVEMHQMTHIPKTDNIFHAILGSKAVKWDAFWHLFEWLMDHDQGHGLGDSVRRQLVAFAFGEREAECGFRREYAVSDQKDGKGKWADFAIGIPDLVHPQCLIVMDDIGETASGGMRKLDNLNAYIQCSLALHPEAIVRAVAVTNAPAGRRLKPVVYDTLGDEVAEFISQRGWKLLPLQTVGQWVQTSLDLRCGALSEKMRGTLGDFVDWCQGNVDLCQSDSRASLSSANRLYS